LPRSILWSYTQKTGELLPDGQLVADGDSGGGDGKNNPDMQAVHNMGPTYCSWSPVLGTDTFGGSGFLMHGDAKESPGGASEACVVMPRPVPEQLWNSGDTELEGGAEFQPQDLQQDKTA